jgi:sugar phosphate isomerase/epimerase
MKMAFSTLACPDWTIIEIANIASACGYDAIELRFVEEEESIWKLPAFHGVGLRETRKALSDRGLQIACVDTSCRFHFPDAGERARWISEGERMAELAAELGAPGIRVFGDQIQPGADRNSTRSWIAESIHELDRKIAPTRVEVWLETHGDFASAAETNLILQQSKSERAGVIWDPANCWLQYGETPRQGAAALHSIRHVHVKDLRQTDGKWTPVLNGEGTFPLQELRTSLESSGFDRYISFEWEKKWHPEIPDANVALPHFARWFREHWQDEH